MISDLESACFFNKRSEKDRQEKTNERFQASQCGRALQFDLLI